MMNVVRRFHAGKGPRSCGTSVSTLHLTLLLSHQISPTLWPSNRRHLLSACMAKDGQILQFTSNAGIIMDLTESQYRRGSNLGSLKAKQFVNRVKCMGDRYEIPAVVEVFFD